MCLKHQDEPSYSVPTGCPLAVELLAPHVLRLFQLDELPQAQVGKSAMGGVRIRFQGRPGEILYSGGLADEKRGYSADLPFFFRRPQAERLTYAGVGLMNGEPDPEAGFAEQVRFSPFLVLRNTTEEELPVDVFLHFTLDGQNQLQPLPVEPLQAGETRQVRLQPLLAKLGLASFNGTFNLTLGFEGRPADLVMALGSVDATGNYVLQAHPDGVGKSLARGLPYWNIEEENDTWISLWNPGQTDQELLLEIRYNQPGGSGSYHHPVSLTAGQSAFVSLRKLIEAQQPDGQGNVIPWDALEGSAVLMSAAGFDQEIDVAAALTILNARLATCSYYCITCYGYTNVFISPSASDILVGEQKQLTLFASHTSGYNYDKTSNASWSSENPSIASVGTGSGTRGLVTGNSPGTTNIRASITLDKGYTYCAYNPYCSSSSKTFTAAAPTTVTPCNNPPIIAKGFRPGTNVKYGFIGTNWTSSIKQCVRDGLSKWSAANQATGLNVTFTEATSGLSLTLTKTNLGGTVAGGITNPTRDSGGYVTGVGMQFTTNTNLLQSCTGHLKVALHETGHILGLGDSSGTGGSSVMNQLNGKDDVGGNLPGDVTPCDRSQAKLASP